MSHPRIDEAGAAQVAQANDSQDSALTTEGESDAREFLATLRSRDVSVRKRLFEAASPQLKRLKHFSPSDVPLADAPLAREAVPHECHETQLEIEEPESEVAANPDGINELFQDPALQAVAQTKSEVAANPDGIDELFNDPDLQVPVLQESPQNREVVPAENALEVPNLPAGHGEVPLADAEGQAREQRARDAHRANSALWHKRWVSKGVPRAAAAAVPEGHGPEPVDGQPRFATLAKARDWFISDWISKSEMPPSQQRRKSACDAWMESSLRADIMAGRLGLQN